MKHLVIIFITFFIASCQTTKNQSEAYDEEYEMRHGWTIFTGPKRTVIDVNDQNSIQRGEVLFATHCTRCHGYGGKGDGPDAKNLEFKPTNLTSLSKSHANYYLVFQINEGKGEMPQWKDILSSREAWDLSNYVQFLHKN